MFTFVSFKPFSSSLQPEQAQAQAQAHSHVLCAVPESTEVDSGEELLTLAVVVQGDIRSAQFHDYCVQSCAA